MADTRPSDLPQDDSIGQFEPILISREESGQFNSRYTYSSFISALSENQIQAQLRYETSLANGRNVAVQNSWRRYSFNTLVPDVLGGTRRFITYSVRGRDVINFAFDGSIFVQIVLFKAGQSAIRLLDITSTPSVVVNRGISMSVAGGYTTLHVLRANVMAGRDYRVQYICTDEDASLGRATGFGNVIDGVSALEVYGILDYKQG